MNTKTENLIDTIESLLADENRRERIRKAGHEMFADVLLRNRWSNVYAGRLAAFVKNPSKQAWENLAIA